MSKPDPKKRPTVESQAIPVILSLLAFCLSTMVAPYTLGEDSVEQTLREARTRIRAIYEEGAFRANRFQADWLPDGSNYVVNETSPETNKRVRVSYHAETGRRTILESGQGRSIQNKANLSPDGQMRLISVRDSLKVRHLEKGLEYTLTEKYPDRDVFIRNPVWSPNGKKIAYIQVDNSEVRRRTMLIPDDPSYPTVKEVRFARVGEVIPTLRVGVINVLENGTGETQWLAIPTPEEGMYLGQVSWTENSNELLIEKFSRFRNERECLLYDVRADKFERIFHETEPAWVIASIAKNTGLEWIEDGRAFIVLSERDGWRHAYVCSRDGQKQRLLTPGKFDIIEKVKTDEIRGWFYFNASPDNGTQKYLYRVALNGKTAPERVTPAGQPGTHEYEFSPDARWAFHTYSRFDVPPMTELVELPQHRTVRVVEENPLLKNKMEYLRSSPTEFLQLDIGNDVVMDAWMIKPPNFDPSKKYPILVYVYGEPHAQTVLDAWGKVQADYHRAVAELGYLVVSIDNRGTPAPKGAAWRRAVFGSLGPLSTDEQAEGLVELSRTRPFVDLTRVGIWGWSGGGSNTLNAMFRRPDIYHVGVAVAPKPQPHLYNAWFQEIYMETRETNPEGYRKAAAINYAEGLEGDLLIVHGTGETNTHLEIVEGLIDRLVELGKPFDYMTYPNRDHGIRKGKGTTVHMRMHMIRYLLNHLKPGPR